MKYSELFIGQAVEHTVQVNPRDVEDFIMLSGDTNSVHTGKNAVVHGALLIAYISKVIGTIIPGDGSVWYGLDVKFIKPVHVWDTLQIKVKVHDMTAPRRVCLHIDIYCGKETCVMSTCLVKVPE